MSEASPQTLVGRPQPPKTVVRLTPSAHRSKKNEAKAPPAVQSATAGFASRI